MFYRIFGVLVVIILVVGSVFLSGQQQESAAPATVEGRGSDMGYAARQAQLIETGEDGKPLYTLTADVINQPPGTAVIDLTQLQMGFRDSTGNMWNGRADHGQVGQDTHRIELSGNVRVTGTLPGSEDAAEIVTQKLSVDTRAETVSTDQPVTLTWSGRAIEATGLVANLKDGAVHLQSNVHGTYLP
jgi:LPS export ABC transporter protein LptC